MSKKIISFDFVKKVFKGEYKRPWSSIKSFKDAEKEIYEGLERLEIDFEEWKLEKTLFRFPAEDKMHMPVVILINNKNGKLKQFSLVLLVKDHFDFNK